MKRRKVKLGQKHEEDLSKTKRNNGLGSGESNGH